MSDSNEDDKKGNGITIGNGALYAIIAIFGLGAGHTGTTLLKSTPPQPSQVQDQYAMEKIRENARKIEEIQKNFHSIDKNVSTMKVYMESVKKQNSMIIHLLQKKTNAAE